MIPTQRFNSSTNARSVSVFPQARNVPVWRDNDARANKNGELHSVYFRSLTRDEKIRRDIWATRSGKYLEGQYVGQWSENQKDGFGIQVERNGDKYEGEWRKGRRHGQGTLYVCIKAKLVKRYEGQWVEDRMEGRGKLYYADGTEYDGEWVNNKRNGHGRFQFGNGDLYDGDWVNEKRHGRGVMYYRNGDRFEGEWCEDQKEGHGQYFYASSHQCYDGEWVDDIAKCGTVTEKIEPPPHSSSQHASTVRPLPPIELVDADMVILLRMEEIRNHRREKSQNCNGGMARASEEQFPDDGYQSDGADGFEPEYEYSLTKMDMEHIARLFAIKEETQAQTDAETGEAITMMPVERAEVALGGMGVPATQGDVSAALSELQIVGNLLSVQDFSRLLVCVRQHLLSCPDAE
mmetsp:Transcript_26785/g.43738  ORF Transcript_26785/g.43738 Transcript_26785/m.43738 type:complete len:405 (+) Transcript_26785:97-1311(+)|eukprot:CAMPEP_0184350150 /NCGR_PEP_ID=MMETSP1089-20130417/37508_1 /TAXON_ID=38269 ORGANISM="Gloeochaete wittrockiana, Strain SAG46.84" /NCGR_SAMPLE_ID=MMETSP1089 /ASSEMBLY_ACC=CAM_ASM_000445 /LENGTH=404 /DNA_ID=CAMNT_0026682733 /DNA_START=92 /DNA_END=1306 /DNA_ORIENTATION=-